MNAIKPFSSAATAREEHPPILAGILHDEASTPEVSTAQLQTALRQGTAIVLDARPYDEYAVSHIPGARSVPGKPGTTAALYVADVTTILDSIPDKAQPLILYCNGPYCGRSKRFADDLLKAGYRDVRRYQLGAPTWRAIGGVMQVEKDALIRLLSQDATALLIDARDDGRLPMTDHNTRIFVVGDNGSEARAVGEAIVRDAFHNVSFYAGSVRDLEELLSEPAS